MATTLRTASRYRRLSRRLARRGVRLARAARPRGPEAVAATVATHQAISATAAWAGVQAMLEEQGLPFEPLGDLNLAGFQTATDILMDALTKVSPPEPIEADTEAVAPFNEAGFDRMVESIITDAARAAQSVTVVSQETEIQHVRHLTLPSCGRCAVLAGRVYRYSDGFLRHPNCDCVMIPTTVAAPDLVYDPVALVESGDIRGLSKADRRALADGADLGRVVNVRLKKAGLQESGRVLARAGRPSPEGIYRMASGRAEAIELLRRFGYLR